MIQIEDVKAWAVDAGVGHICMSAGDGWLQTACGSWQTGDATTERPKRVCRKCRKMLLKLNVNMK